MHHLLFLLAAYGICFGFVNKVTFLRRSAFLSAMLECTYCIGFHSGWLTYLLMSPSAGFEWSEVVASAFASAAFCYIIDTAVICLEEKTAGLRDEGAKDHPNLFG